MTASLLPRLRGSSALDAAARAGLVGRGLFYLLLAALAVGLLLGPPRSGPQANANGALTEVASSRVGLLLLAAVVGFAAYGVVRLAGAAGDEQQGGWRRLSTAGQGLVYSRWPARRRLPARASHDRLRAAAAAHGWLRPGAARWAAPGGRGRRRAPRGLLLAGDRRGHFADTLQTEQMGRNVRRLTAVTARVGIPARAVSFLPVGGFLVVAGVRSDPRPAKGLDALLLELTGTGVGKAVVVLVAAGFVVFAAYSFLEARYRRVFSGA